MSADAYVLGVDPGLHCGFALLRMHDASRVISGMWRLHPRVGDGDGARFVRLHDHLDATLQTHPTIVSVAYEVPGEMRRRDGGRASPATYLGLYGLVAHVESWAERRQLHYCGFAPQQVKRAAGCSGNAPKADVVAAIVSRYAIDLSDDNECDAIAIACAGVARIHEQKASIA